MSIIDERRDAQAACEAEVTGGADGPADPPDAGGITPPAGTGIPQELTDLAPDAELAAVLAALDPTELEDYQLVEAAAAFQRMAAWANAKLAEVAEELSRRPVLTAHGALPSGIDAGNMAADELAPRLGISRWAAQRLVRNGRGFARQFHPTGQALLAGEIDIQKASTVVTLLDDYPAELAFRVQEEVLPDAGLQTHSQLVAAIRKAVIAIAHDEADHLHTKARTKRRVDHPRQLPDGMASLLAILPATDAVALDLALETAARTARKNGDCRTLDQLRADTLSLMGHAALENGYVGIPPALAGQAATAEQAKSAGQAERGSPTEPPEHSEQTQLIPEAEPAEPVTQTEPAKPAEQASSEPEPGSAGKPPPPVRLPDADPTTTAAASAPVPALVLPGDDDAGDFPTCPTAVRTFYTCCDGTGTCSTAGPPPTDELVERSEGRSEGTAVPSQGTGASGGAFLRRPHMRLGQIAGGRARINVTVPLSVLLPPDVAHQLGLPARTAPPTDDLSEHTGTAAELVPLPEDDVLLALLECEPVEVAELEGYGPISPAVARAAALGGSWRRLVTDPLTGIVLDHGRERYRPPADLAELIRLRDGTCVRAGCSSPARSCELDHTIAWAAGGTTAMINLDDLCVRDHLIKTDGAFTIRHVGGGTFDWTTATGHVYRRHRGGRVTFRGAAPVHAAQVARSQPPPF